MPYFKEQLQKQLVFLQASSEAYDKGNTDEGIRIAMVLRVLFHDTKNSTSLISHLHATKVKLLSTCTVVPPGAGFWSGLTNMELRFIDEIARFNPLLDAAIAKRLVGLNRWWRSESVYFINPTDFSRRRIVLGAANQDGGAHVDAKLDNAYEVLSRKGAEWSVIINPADGSPSKTLLFNQAHLAALRQMAYEVLHSPELVGLAT